MSKLRRSMLFVPGANAAMLSNTFIYQPDAIMFDLEDSVALREKDTARMLVFNALQHPLYQEIETVVRVNPLESEFGFKRSACRCTCGRQCGSSTKNRQCRRRARNGALH